MDLRTIAEAAEALVERRGRDGLAISVVRRWAHQTALARSKKGEAWLLGANRSGKSEAGADIIAAFARFGLLDPAEAYLGPVAAFSPKLIWVVSLTWALSRDVMQTKLFDNGVRVDSEPPRIPKDEIAGWNVTNQTLKLRNGSIIVFKSCEQGRDSFMSQGVDLIVFDEVPDEEVYRESTMRVGGGRRLYIRGAATILPPAGTPGGISWMYPKIVKGWLSRGETGPERNGMSAQIDIFTAGIRDNPSIAMEEVQRIETIFPPGSLEHRIRVLGELLPSIAGALVYAPFNSEYHVVEGLAPVDPRYNRRFPVIIPHMPLALCVDFNAENGTWVVGQKIGSVFRFLDEIHLEQSDVASMSYEFRARYPTHSAELRIYGDATGHHRSPQTAMSSFHMIQQYLTGYPVPIRFMVPDANPTERSRVDAVNLQLRPPSGERLVEFSPLCVETIADAEGTKWGVNGKIDKRHSRRSDGMDDVGYMISFECPTSAAFVTPLVKSIATPRYFHGPGPHPGVSNRPVRIGNRWYGRRIFTGRNE